MADAESAPQKDAPSVPSIHAPFIYCKSDIILMVDTGLVYRIQIDAVPGDFT